MALWHCGEPTCTWTVTAWRLHIPFSLGITVVFCLAADVSQMACYRINCKVALNWSFSLSYANVLCAQLFITWTTLITPHTHTHSHTHRLTHPPTERSILARCIAFILQIELHNALGYFQTGRNKDKQRKWGKCETTTNNKKEQRKQ